MQFLHSFDVEENQSPQHDSSTQSSWWWWWLLCVVAARVFVVCPCPHEWSGLVDYDLFHLVKVCVLLIHPCHPTSSSASSSSCLHNDSFIFSVTCTVFLLVLNDLFYYCVFKCHFIVFLLHFYAWCKTLWVALLLKCAIEINPINRKIRPCYVLLLAAELLVCSSGLSFFQNMTIFCELGG